ncbi:uncharacterized protein TRUGW13939_09604 [Talaromyces rugulosus]|uniref:Peroxisomal ATPase PEX1 n=1 Tax=Talaromyces rugulosus TaxID=121627 RepID=A0A7H8RD09_TALRU|nr:uncharacterized protein TRUGW13939_09604 [Talaromyces rugulosus]QKX62443.1 hypothetical protein TRUGW13939_09604 [Talaromyces rugulosus]
MAPSRKSSTAAEVALVPLKTCLVNLPTSVVSLLVNANAAAQNVIVELQYRSSGSQSATQRSSYLGWTGMPSRRKVAPVVSRDGISASSSSREQEVAVVEIDSTFGRVLGLTEGQKVGLFLHLDPPIAHTINIEPLTPADWEIIELHASFLELNLLHQIRALPNPAFTGASTTPADHLHPLTLHLSPTSTANIVVTSLTPAPPTTSPFAKIAPDAEVIVAPKVRPKSGKANRGENRSTTSNSRKSVGGRSTSSTVKAKSRDSESDQPAVYFRGLDRRYAEEWFDEDVNGHANEGLKIWVDRDVLATNQLRGNEWAAVSIVQPAGLQAPLDPQQQLNQKEQESAEVGRPSAKLVAKLIPWDDAPDDRHAALSSMLCTALSSSGIVGGVVKVEPAPTQLSRSTVKSIKLYPFASDPSKKKDGLKFGGDTAASRSALAERIKVTYGSPGSEAGFMSGPLTDGMVLPAVDSQFPAAVFDGGIVKFDPPSKDSGPSTTRWILGSESKFSIDVQAEIPKPIDATLSGVPTDENIPSLRPEMVGIDSIISQSLTNLSRNSSMLLTGGLGSGKTTLCQLLAHRLREEHLYNVTYFSCRKLVTDETRVSTIKETLSRLFLTASWCARLGGRALVILDDLDKICPVETELQVGGDNGRSRQVSELVGSIVREHCTMTSSVLLLATAQAKESLNNTVVGGHVVREIVSLKAPNKEGRRKVLEKLTNQDKNVTMSNGHAGHAGHSRSESGSTQESWLDPSNPGSRPSSSDADGFVLSRDLDFLDLAGKTDGYMPGDLVLLVSRARNEALIRSVQDSNTESTKITLTTDDFDRALKGFTPASLRNVTLTSSSTTFSSIGGLHETRQTLLETLEYPTKYAPIFAQCPLRLRSGLLLYGFPGCGKTMLASAVAGECGLNFISVKGPEILNKYIGASEKSVRDLFERAEAARPCILFFDEFDSIAPKRGHDSTGVTDRVVNQLLTQMDGAEGLSGVYVLAATSRPDLIDPALLRPGRLDKSLLCDMPSHDDRVDIIQAVSKKLKLNHEVESRVGEIASRTEGYSGADIQAVVYNAHLEAIHDLLGDRTSGNTAASTTKRANGAQTNGSDAAAHKTFIQFLYSDEQVDGDSVARTKLPPPAVVAAKLEAFKQARRRQRQLEHGSHQDDTQQQQPNGTSAADDPGDEVIIGWQHIEKSLATTRSSLSDRERRRLDAIYNEFVVGRNGEMPDGEGAKEIGGRTSLM